MSPDPIRHRAEQLARALSLPAVAVPLLENLAGLDLDREAAARARQEDEQGRQGALSFAILSNRLATEDPSQLEDVLMRLADWGVIQMVGQEPSDPVLAGSVAIRLVYSGRALLGLAPSRAFRELKPGELSQSWEIWHGSCREGLLLDAVAQFPIFGLQPILLRPDELKGATLAGRVAERLCADGVVVLDGTGLEHPRHAGFLEDLLMRTRDARLPRVLLVHSPAVARIAALATGARLRWCELPKRSRRDDAVMDERATERLLELSEHRTIADVSGVPESEIAIPRRVATSWDDLLVPEAVRQQLLHALMHARYRLDYLPSKRRRSTGYRLLLSGLPGTGKSMAAEALATTLKRPLVRLDLSSVLSKWLGETERFLAQVFEVAEISGAVLVLDEADALFRQRESSGSGRDGLVTIVSYLLARLDRFEGVLVATTNRTRDLDEAFFRRFDDFVVLPVPDTPTRAKLWAQLLGEAAPERELDRVDFAILSERFPISGGLIRCASIRAAAWASGLEIPLDTSVVLASLSRELEKSDRDPKEVLVGPHRTRVEALLRGLSPQIEEQQT